MKRMLNYTRYEFHSPLTGELFWNNWYGGVGTTTGSFWGSVSEVALQTEACISLLWSRVAKQSAFQVLDNPKLQFRLENKDRIPANYRKQQHSGCLCVRACFSAAPKISNPKTGRENGL